VRADMWKLRDVAELASAPTRELGHVIVACS
jgi:hypothetical protein